MDYGQLVRQYDTVKKEIAKLQQRAKKLQGQILDRFPIKVGKAPNLV